MMTPLREQMIAAMRQRGFSIRTHRSYLWAVTDLARYYRRSPAQLSVAELQRYFEYLAQERGLSGASCRLSLHGIRFLYLKVLEWPSFDVSLVLPKRAQRVPELLTRAEVALIFQQCGDPKHRMMLQLTYGCGLRVSELVALRVRDIDGERRVLRIEQGKGAKDRMVLVGETLLDLLRHYWCVYRPQQWLFPGPSHQQPLSLTTPQKVFRKAKRRAGIEKVGGIHALRHAYASHQLENGLPVHELQRLLGHTNLQSTLRYVHWLPGIRAASQGHADLIALLGERS